MADEVDLAQEHIEREEEARRASREPFELNPGAPGDCEYCGDWFGRLIGGACGFCRDRYKLP